MIIIKLTQRDKYLLIGFICSCALILYLSWVIG